LKVIGVTGGIGMGKSAAESFLRQRGVPVVDTDVLARQIVEPGQPALDEIRRSFGPTVVGPDGRLRREEVARVVFADDGARRKLEGILHPRIRWLWHGQIELWRKEDKPVAAVVIPLLFETGAESELDETICIACTSATQRQRLLARGWSEAEAEQRIRAQMPIEKKMEEADYVIWNEGPLDLLSSQLDMILG
jgi:dephospho-CoA kinase